jgi:non-ribosomal peptide synthetase component F
MPSAPPFRQLLVWLAQQQHPDALSSARDYWHAQLAGMPVPATIAGAASTSRSSQHSSPTERLLRTPEETERIRSAVRGQKLPLGVLMQGVWACLLGRYTGRDEVVHGLKIAGRPAGLAGATNMPGVFANLVPCRLELAPEQTMLDWLRALQQHNRVLHAHEQHPLHRVLAWAGLPADQPLFDTVLALEDMGVVEPFRDLDLRLEQQSRFRRTPVPLWVSLASVDGRLSVQITYDDDLFTAEVVQRILRDYCRLLDLFATDPHRPVHAFLAAASALSPRA